MASNPKVLLVDDEEEFHVNLKFALNKYFDFICVKSIPNAINKIRDINNEFDLILIDLKMSDWDEELEGFKLMEMTKNHPRNIPFIAVTNNDYYKNAVRAIQTGAYDYIYKKEYRPEDWKYVFYDAMSFSKLKKGQENGNKNSNMISNSERNIIRGSEIEVGGDFHIGDIINIELIKSSSSISSEAHLSKGSIQKQLRDLLQKGEVKQSLETLLRAADMLDQDLSDEALYLCSRWNELTKKSDMGIYHRGEEEMYKSRIVRTLISIINRITLASGYE